MEVLQKKFEEFQTDLAAHEERVNEVNQDAAKLTQENHPETELILKKQEEVNTAWQRLKGLAQQRQGKLFGAAEVQRFNRCVTWNRTMLIGRVNHTLDITAMFVWNEISGLNFFFFLFLFCRDVDETISWINEKEQLMASDDFGRDLASVQALLRKHEGLERDLAALEDKVSLSVTSFTLNNHKSAFLYMRTCHHL